MKSWRSGLLRIDWRTKARWFVAEFVVVVSGILVALALNAWWQGRQDGQRERAALIRLKSEFESAASMLVEERRNHEALRARLDRMLELLAAEGDPPGSKSVPDSVIAGTLGTVHFDPARGALLSLINSGDIGLIRSDSLRIALTAWLDLVETETRDEAEERRVYETFQLPLMWHTIPLRNMYAGGGATPATSSTRGPKETLFSSPAFENVVRWRYFNNAEALSSYDILEGNLGRVLSMIDAELE